MTKTFKQLRHKKVKENGGGDKKSLPKFSYSTSVSSTGGKSLIKDTMGGTKGLPTYTYSTDVVISSKKPKVAKEEDFSWQKSMRQGHRGGSKGTPKLFMKRHSRDSTSGSLTDKQIQNLKKTWNNPSKVFTKDAEKFVKDMVKKLDNDSRYRLAKAGIKHISKLAEEAPANATGSAVVGTGDDSSTVLVKRRKELQKRLMRRFSIKETLDRILPNPVEKEDEITTRKKQLKELAKNRNV